MLNGEDKIKLGDLSPTRDLLFVKDTANGFIEIAKSNQLIGEDCNIATETEISIGDLADEIIAQINPSAKIIQDDQRIRPAKSEVFRLYGSSAKIREHTNWKAQYSLSEGIEETIKWFQNPTNLAGYKHGIYNI